MKAVISCCKQLKWSHLSVYCLWSCLRWRCIKGRNFESLLTWSVSNIEQALMTIKECRLLHIFFMFSLYFEICHKSDTQIYGPLKVFQEFFVKRKRTSKISEFTASFLQINCVSTFESCGFSLHNFFRK